MLRSHSEGVARGDVTDMTTKRFILEASTVFFSVLFLLFLVSAQAEEEVRDASAGTSQVEEELLISPHPVGKRGGRLVAALRAEPKTLNPLTFVDEDSQTVINRLMADLLHVNRHTQEVETALAKSWTVSDDGRRYRLNLRRGVRFSDGHPFDADDVIFTFTVYLDEKVDFRARDLLLVGGVPIKVRKIDRYTVDVELAEPFALGERIFDSMPILPRHVLQEKYEQGTIRDVWALTDPVGSVVGLGPFRLKKYIPGERYVLERNPFYWKMDKAGQRLPYFDELTFLFIASDDARLLRFQAGATDVVDRLEANSFGALERGRQSRKFRLVDRGPGLAYEFLFFNLNDLSDSDLLNIRDSQHWFRQLAFRRAVSLGIDRASLVRLAFQGRASPLWSHVTPGNKRWVNREIATPPRSVAAARSLLENAGFSWNGKSDLLDTKGRAVEFSIIVNSGSSRRMQMATIIQDDLEDLGMRVHIVPMEPRSLLDRVTRSYDYEACLLGLSSEPDPYSQMPVLLSDGGLHLWHLGQKEPATLWEAEIDRLMTAQSATVDQDLRKKHFDAVQVLMAENQPMVFLVSPHVLVGASSDLGNFEPAVLDHPTLWNVEQLYRRARVER